jgi:biotin transporter BioY
MTHETILVLLAGLIGVLFAVLVGLLWMMVRAGLDDDHNTHDTHDNRQGSASPELRDGVEAHERSPRQSKVAA